MSTIYGDKEAPPLYVCIGCKKLGSKDLYVWWRKRCPLCGLLTKLVSIEEVKETTKKRRFPKDVQRFPRLLAATEEQSKVVEVINTRTRDFDCPGKVIEVLVGPMVTEYKFQPDRFTRLWRIKTINEDLAMALEAENVAVRRVPGEAAIGIAVPNKVRTEVSFDSCLENVVKHRFDMELPVNFGVTSTGQPYIEDLVRMPHLLVAGATGSGKSVFLNNLITNLLYIRSPKQLKLMLIDPKHVELLQYKGLAHMMQNPVASVYEALDVMERTIQEMKRRVSFLHSKNCKNIKEYNEKIQNEADALKAVGQVEESLKKQDEQWPYIVMVIDEMADLVLQEKKSFTEKMASIAAMARAAGIHVIAATQRPSVDVLNGKIKVNFPARVGFRVPSSADSKTVLNYKGAEQLLGQGDMFYISPERPGMQRLHSPNAKPQDVELMIKRSLQAGYTSVLAESEKSTVEGPVEPGPAVKKPNGKTISSKPSSTLVN